MSGVLNILIRCHDQKGLVYEVSKIFLEFGLNVENNREFVDESAGIFFMRSVVSGVCNSKALREALKSVLPKDNFLKVVEPSIKKIVIFATKELHVLADIITRVYEESISAEIVAVISNYRTVEPFVKKFDIPFFYVPVSTLDRSEHEDLISKILDNRSFDYIVLAKYMRIFTPEFVRRYREKIINIHHSFLPAFIGANPYKQAYDRGVKIIGATAHFVNDNLDEGPIIAQDTITVDHTFSWKDMQKAGSDVEKILLSKSLHLVLSDRVFVYGNRCIVFS